MTILPESAEPHRLLLVEDDPELASLVREYLCKHGFQVDLETNGLEAAKRIVADQPDLVILDVMLPGMRGTDVCKQVRQSYAGPIMMLTALDEDMDQMLGLELGADDYVIKPVKPRLLLTRIRTLLRRVTPALSPESDVINLTETTGSAQEISIGQLTINPASRTVCNSGSVIELTTAEYDLLMLLAESVGSVIDRDTIIQRLRGLDYDGIDRSIDRRISRLRKKLQDDPAQPQLIKTVRGKGYQLCLR